MGLFFIGKELIMNIKIIAVGKIKEKYITEGIKELSKRISRDANLEIIEIQDEKAPENLSPKEMELIKDKEGERITRKIPDNSYVISLDIEGKNLTSVELAVKVGKMVLDGVHNLTFIIGGSLGLSKGVLSRSDFKLSFSKMTFPHQLMRLILLEQLCRSFAIKEELSQG